MKKNEDKVSYGYEQKKGEKVHIVFMDGEILRGTLLHAGRYELHVNVQDIKAEDVIVFKHAIKYMY
ncbi:hypothetical protein [Carnobacterium funditum]|uniref:hypothetical protein n=1 Tax=Carnobacterium funditum TaxID=2752 RepID=UPI0005564BB9|nr:hypothetical protein [Carnobacterium funditum]